MISFKDIIVVRKDNTGKYIAEDRYTTDNPIRGIPIKEGSQLGIN